MATTGKQLFSTLADGKLTVEVVETEFAEPIGNQVLVEMEAAAQAIFFTTDYHKDAVRRFVDKEQLAFNWEAMDKAEREKAVKDAADG